MKFFPGAAFVAIVSASLPARAEVFWKGDAETGDTKQWPFQLNPRGLSVVTDPVREGSRSYKVEITSADLWPGNQLNRVELQYKPAAARMGAGKETFFAWSFYVPKALSSDSHQIGYWESDKTYRQVMSLTVQETNIRFETRLPQNRLHWTGTGKATAGKWHDVVMHIKWAQTDTGEVSLWFDGEKVVNAVKAQTMADANPLFVQVGMLRGKADAPAEIMHIDRALEGSGLQDVQAPPQSMPDGGSMSTPDAGAGGSGGNAGGSGGGAGAAGQSGGGGSAGSGGKSASGGKSGNASGGQSGGSDGEGGRDGEGGSAGQEEDDDAGKGGGKSGGCSFAPHAQPGLMGIAAFALAALMRRRRRS